jgi:N-acylneuraminate cytidylyltransferase
MDSKEILAIIPARGQSKGVQKKNIRSLAGKPLITYTIKAALDCKTVSRVVVSTEDDEIAHISKVSGAKAIKRPMELAKDDSPTIDAIFHVLDTLLELEDYDPETIVLLQATSPLRIAGDIENALKLYEITPCESVISVVEHPHSPYWMLKVENEYLVPLFGTDFTKMRRQELPRAYLPNGAIFIASPRVIRQYRSFYCGQSIPYVMSPERSIDIDTELDFMLAECLLERLISI